MEFEFGNVRLDAIVEGEGPAVVLIHGFPLAKETWDAQAAVLAKRARVVRFDLRGLGKSSVPLGPYLMETLASDCSDVLDALGIERATIVGHSLGGYVAFAFHRLFSERCAGLGLVCTRAIDDDAPTAAARFELADRAEREGIDPVVASYLPRYFAPAFYETHPEVVEKAAAILRATNPSGAAAMLRGMAARVPSDDLFSEIAVPVRVIAATRDALAPVALSESIARGIPGAVLDRLDCGHFPLYEEAAALTVSLEALLDDVRDAEKFPGD
jgi:pimeloyl-ACP methyl ester carboxylesterase